MSDIVERLRGLMPLDHWGGDCPHCIAHNEAVVDAVDEIERLRDNALWQSVRSDDLKNEIERLRAAIDTFLAEVDSQHAPEWASPEAKAAGKEPWVCVTCGVADGHWPCTERMALDDLIAARRKDQP